MDNGRRRFLKQFAMHPVLASSIFNVTPILSLILGSGVDGPPNPDPTPTRTWEMGFFFTPPRPEIADAIQTINLFSLRSELAVIHEELPWIDLLNGVSADSILENNKKGLIDYLRSKGQRLFFMADLTDGLSRGEEAPQLRQLGRSIAEPEVQQVYRDYVLTFVEKFRPDYIGLAAETNLIRKAAAPAVYTAVVQAANAAAADLAANSVTEPVLISVQVETAWGVLGSSGPYVGIETDFQDFPFIDVLGLSSYPYFSFSQPEDIPEDYYSRLLNGRSIPAAVCEGGWNSVGFAGMTSSPEKQERYITRHADLLDRIAAVAAIQTLFADIDLDSLPPPLPENLPFFTSIGLTEMDFNAKPALTAWDNLFARQKISS